MVQLTCPHQIMKCPHCLTSYHINQESTDLGKDIDGYWSVRYEICPACGKFIVYLRNSRTGYQDKFFLVRPKGVARSPLPQELDDPQVTADYTEASLVLADSTKASAALSRRTLQYILREKANVKHANLSVEIQEVLDRNTLPSDIADNLDAVRNIGNFAAHPIKSTSTGEIVDVEPNEAEWNLEVLEQLIDFYYVRPAIAKKKRDELNAKLVGAGKPPLK